MIVDSDAATATILAERLVDWAEISQGFSICTIEEPKWVCISQQPLPTFRKKGAGDTLFELESCQNFQFA